MKKLGLAFLGLLAATGCAKHSSSAPVVPPHYYHGYQILTAGCPNSWSYCYYNGNAYLMWLLANGYTNAPSDTTYIYIYWSNGTSNGSNTSNGSGTGGGTSTGSGSTGSGSGTGGGSSTGGGSTGGGSGTGGGGSTGGGSGTGGGGSTGGGSTGSGSGTGGGSSTGSGSTGSSTTGSGNSFSVRDALSQSSGFQLPDGKGGMMNCDGNECGALPGIDQSNNNGLGNSIGSDTHDTDLQRAEAQEQNLADRAQGISDQYQMSYDKALELTQLADKVQAMTVQGQMTEADRDAVVESAMKTAGVTEEEVNAAVVSVGKDGNQNAINALMEKAAKNLGMPSSAGLRDQILPSLGIQI